MAVNIGDSRLYEISGGADRTDIRRSFSGGRTGAKRRTKSQVEARKHPDKNIITRALGIQDEAQMDLFPFHVEPGNRYLLCSDGLSNMVEDDRSLPDYQ